MFDPSLLLCYWGKDTKNSYADCAVNWGTECTALIWGTRKISVSLTFVHMIYVYYEISVQWNFLELIETYVSAKSMLKE